MQQHNPDKTLNCLLQADVSGESSKSGLSRNETIALLTELLELNIPNLAWRGLMTIGVQADETETRKVFSDLRKLRFDVLFGCISKYGLSYEVTY